MTLWRKDAVHLIWLYIHHRILLFKFKKFFAHTTHFRLWDVFNASRGTGVQTFLIDRSILNCWVFPQFLVAVSKKTILLVWLRRTSPSMFWRNATLRKLRYCFTVLLPILQLSCENFFKTPVIFFKSFGYSQIFSLHNFAVSALLSTFCRFSVFFPVNSYCFLTRLHLPPKVINFTYGKTHMKKHHTQLTCVTCRWPVKTDNLPASTRHAPHAEYKVIACSQT